MANGIISEKRVSWAAIFAGTVVALVTQVTLSTLGAAVGLASVSNTSDLPAAMSLSLGAAAWLLVSTILSSGTGGFISGRLVDAPSANRGGYHGLISWATTTLVILILVSSAIGTIVSGSFGAATSILGGASRAVGTSVQTAAPALAGNNQILNDINRQINVAGATVTSTELREKTINAVRAALTGDPTEQERAMNDAVETLAQAKGVSQDQAREDLKSYQKQYEAGVAKAKAKAAQLAETSAKATSSAALGIFLTLLFGAIAACVGGRIGNRSAGRETEAKSWFGLG